MKYQLPKVKESKPSKVSYFEMLAPPKRVLNSNFSSHLLNWLVDYVWLKNKTKRFWLHTCDLDHPKAINVYEKAGFVFYKEEIEMVDVLETSTKS